ncbi:MAG: saccharopine dehydrogenase family protein [Cyanothece sp. SIO2G6]|nr:saccharopine dehydrogenase family protein [Cyanothece sp. SIO2G6]
MHRVTILGAGKIGSAIAKLLCLTNDYVVCVGDTDTQALDRLSASLPVTTITVDVTDEEAIAQKLAGEDCVVSACPYWANPGIARAAAKAGVNYFDLTEDVTTTDTVRNIAAKTIAATTSEPIVFAPQCGLAPGFINILAHHLCCLFDKLDEVKLRVGALPQYPTNRLMYNLTWSTKGLINEYCNPCDVIHEGNRIQAVPLEELEHFSVNGANYEAFNTSGGLGTLCETLEGKVRTLNYKTIRYQGHRDLMAFLLGDLRLSSRRDLLEEIFEYAIPTTKQDVVLSFCTVTGWKDGQFKQVSDARKIYPRHLDQEQLTAIQISTAASLCAVMDLYLDGEIPHRGFLKQEDISLDRFLANRFGRYYNDATGAENHVPDAA